MILKPTHALMPVIEGDGGTTRPTFNPTASESPLPPYVTPKYEDPDPLYDDDYFNPNTSTATDTSGGGTGTADTSGTTDPVEEPGLGEGVPDMPGGHEVWLVDGVTYLVWFVPGTEPPVPIMYEVTADVEIGTLTPDKTLTQADVRSMGGLQMGSARLVDNPDQHPYETFIDKWEDELEVKPWLEDPEIMAKMFGAFVEGRTMTLAELQTTEWWKTHTDQQRQWSAVNFGDPATAQQMIEDNRMKVRTLLISSGMDEPPEGLINIIADNATKGEWSAEYTNNQIKAVTDPYAGIELDVAVSGWLTENAYTPDTTQTFEGQVRDMVARWLGPAFAAGWTDDNVAQWAGEFRNNPDAEEELREMLKQQRLALYPGYTNENLTYEDIAAPWRALMMSQWGVSLDEVNDPLLHQIINLNDAGKAQTLLRKEGMARGNTLTMQRATQAFADAMGGAVVRTDPAVR